MGGGATVILYSTLLLAIVLHNCKPDDVDYDGDDDAGADLRFSLSKPLRLEVYYSPLDKDMQKFFESQVLPVVSSALGKRINIKLIPFAGCMLERNEATGKINVTCPDDSKAADAGLQHFCGYELLTAETDKSFVSDQSTKRFSKGFQYILCVIKSRDFLKCWDKIFKKPAPIEKCMSLRDAGSVEWAFERMKQVGVRTFPTIVTMHEQHNKAQDAEAQRSLWNVVCRRLGRSGPEECRNVTGRTANESAPVDTTTTATKVSTTTAKSKGIGGLVGHTLLPCLLIMSASAFL